MADITTTLKVKDQATKEIETIRQTLLGYQSAHQKTANTFKAENKSMEESERKLSSALKATTEKKKTALLALQTFYSNSTREQKKQLSQQVDDKKIQLQQMESLEKRNNDRMEALMKQSKTATAMGRPSTSVDSNIAEVKKEKERIIAQKEKLSSDLMTIDASRIRTTHGKQELALKSELDLLKKKNNAIRNATQQNITHYETQTNSLEKNLDKQIQIEKESSNTLEKLQNDKLETILSSGNRRYKAQLDINNNLKTEAKKHSDEIEKSTIKTENDKLETILSSGNRRYKAQLDINNNLKTEAKKHSDEIEKSTIKTENDKLETILSSGNRRYKAQLDINNNLKTEAKKHSDEIEKSTIKTENDKLETILSSGNRRYKAQLDINNNLKTEAKKHSDEIEKSTIKTENDKLETILSSGNRRYKAQLDINNNLERLSKEHIVQLNKETIAKRKARKETELNKLSLKEEYKRLYENTSATNAYESSLKKLNTMKKSGAIGSKQYATALEKEEQRLKEATLAAKKKGQSTDSMTNGVVRHLRQLETLVVAYYSLKTAYDVTVGKGIEMSKMMESNTFGIAALTSANTRMVDSQGNALTAMEKFTAGQKIAKGVMAELRVESLKTPATYGELIGIYQQATGQTLAMGDAFGTTVEDINKNTIKLSSRMSQFGAAIGMPMDRIKEEIRSLLSGNASTDSLISTMLFSSPGEANKAIRMAGQKTEGLVKLLEEKFRDFDILATTRSYEKGFLQMQGAWEIAMSDMVQKSKMFEDITDAFYDMAETITEDTDSIVESFDEIYQGAKDFVDVAENFVIPATAIASVYALNTAFALLAKNPIVSGALLLGAGMTYLGEKTRELAESRMASIEDTAKSGLTTESSDAEIKKQLESKFKQLDTWTIKLAKDYKKSGNESNIFQINKKWVESLSNEIVMLQKLQDGTIKKTEDSIKSAKLISNLALPDTKEMEKFLGKSKTKTEELSEQMVKWSNNLISVIQKEKTEKAKLLPEEASLVKIAETRKKIEESIAEATSQTLAEYIKSQTKKEKAYSKEFNRAVRLTEQWEKQRVAQQEADPTNVITKFEDMSKWLEKSNKDSLKIANNFEKIQESIFKSQSVSSVTKGIDLSGMSPVSRFDLYEGLITTYGEDTESQAKLGDWISDFEKDFNAKIKPLKFDTELNLPENQFSGIFDDIKELGKMQVKYNKIIKPSEEEKVDYLDAQVAGYSNLAGSMASAFRQGSDGAIAFTAIQAGLGIASSWTAITEAWALGFPQNIPAVATVTSAVMPIISQLGGSTSAGASAPAPDYSATIESARFGNDTYSRQGVDIGDYSGNFDKFIEGLDSAAQRLENFGSVGSSLSGQLTSLSKGIVQSQNNIDYSTDLFRKHTEALAKYTEADENSITPNYKPWDYAREQAGLYYETLDRNIESEIIHERGILSQYRTELSAILTDTLSESLDFSLIEIPQLESYVKGIDVSAYEKTLKQINNIAIQVKQSGGIISDSQQDRLIELYTLPDYIQGQDYQEAIDVLEEYYETIKENTKDIFFTANSMEASFLNIGKTSEEVTALRMSHIEREKVFLSNELPALSTLTADNFLTLYRNIDPSNTDLISSYKEYGGLLAEQAQLNYEASDAIQSSISSSVKAVRTLSDAFWNMGESIEDTIEKLLGASDDANAQDQLISSFWSKRAELDVLLAKDGDLTSSQQKAMQDLVGDVNSLSLSIQGAEIGDNTAITGQLVNELGFLRDEIDFDNQILKVNIVASELAFGLASTSPTDEIGVLSALPSYDVGTNYVSYDQIAKIHQGERILTPEENRHFSFPRPNGFSDNSQLIKAINNNSALLKDNLTKITRLDKNINDAMQGRNLRVKVA